MEESREGGGERDKKIKKIKKKKKKKEEGIERERELCLESKSRSFTWPRWNWARTG